MDKRVAHIEETLRRGKGEEKNVKKAEEDGKRRKGQKNTERDVVYMTASDLSLAVETLSNRIEQLEIKLDEAKASILSLSRKKLSEVSPGRGNGNYSAHTNSNT